MANIKYFNTQFTTKQRDAIKQTLKKTRRYLKHLKLALKDNTEPTDWGQFGSCVLCKIAREDQDQDQSTNTRARCDYCPLWNKKGHCLNFAFFINEQEYTLDDIMLFGDFIEDQYMTHQQATQLAISWFTQAHKEIESHLTTHTHITHTSN